LSQHPVRSADIEGGFLVISKFAIGPVNVTNAVVAALSNALYPVPTILASNVSGVFGIYSPVLIPGKRLAVVWRHNRL
jgi:hypothetical protein